MKVSSGFRYAVQAQVAGKWQTRMSGDDLTTVQALYDKSKTPGSSISLRLLDQTTNDVLALHVAFSKSEKVW